MERLKYLIILSLLQLHLSSLNAQDQNSYDWMGSSDVCPLNMASIKGQLSNTDEKLEKSLDEKTAEILEQIKKNDVKANLGVYETFIENTIDKKLHNLQAKASSGTIEAVYLISMIINERFSKMEKSVEQVNDRLTKIEETSSEKVDKIGDAVQNLQLLELNTKFDTLEQKLTANKAANLSTGVPQSIGTIYNCALARHLEMTPLSTGKYHFNSNRMTWYDAKKYCEKYDMQLVTINTNEEARALVQVKKMDDAYWTSASDIGRTPGHLYWANGQRTEKWVWNSGEPNTHGAGKETCAFMRSDFLLGDQTCSINFYFICEMLPYCKNQINLIVN